MAEIRLIPGSEIVGNDGTVQAFGLQDLVTGESMVVPNHNGAHDMFMEQERQMNQQPVTDSAPMGDAPGPAAPEPTPVPVDAPVPAPAPEAVGSMPPPPVAAQPSMPSPQQASGTPMPDMQATPAPVEPTTTVAPAGPTKIQLDTSKTTSVGEGSRTRLDKDALAAQNEAATKGYRANAAVADAATAQAEYEKTKAVVQHSLLQDQITAEIARKEAENQERVRREDEVNQDIESFSDMKIDNNRRWANASTGDRVVTGIALLLGSIGSAFSGKENPVIKMMDDDIRRDIEAQKAAIQNKSDAIAAKRGMLGELDKRYGDLDKSAEVLRAMNWAAVSKQLEVMDKDHANPQIQAAKAQADAEVAKGKANALKVNVNTSGGRTTSEKSSEEQIPKGLTTNVTEGADKEMRDAAITRNSIDAVIPELADPKVRSMFGQAGSRLSYIERFFNATTPEADQFRARLEAIKTKIRSKAFGASLTQNELDAFEKFVPGDTASADRILNALTSLRNDAELTEGVVRKQNENKAGLPAKVGKYQADIDARTEAMKKAGATPVK